MDKIKLYVKKEDNKFPFVQLFVTFLFLIFSIVVFYIVFKEDNLKDIIFEHGISLTFAVIFFSFAIYFLYLLLKLPNKYTGKLIYKYTGFHNGEDVTYLEFSLMKMPTNSPDYTPDKYKCFLYGDINLKVDELYYIYIKIFHWKIKSFNPEPTQEIIRAKTSSMFAIFFAFMTVIVQIMIICLLGIFYFEEYKTSLIAVLSFLAISFPFMIILYRKIFM